MLKLRFTNNKQNAVWLVEPKVTIGRSAACDLVLDHSDIQAQHAEILVNHEQLKLNLLVETSSTFVNGKLVKMGVPVVLKPLDTLRLADAELQVIDPKQQSKAAPTVTRQEETTGWALKANHSALANRIFALKTENIVGRSNDCDITLAAAHLSRRHAQLIVKEGLLYVKDLGSSNGTYVNGKRVTQARVKRGDDLRFDTLSFGVIGPSDDLDKTTVRSVPQGLAKAASESAGASGSGPRPTAKPAQRKPSATKPSSPSNSSGAVEAIEPTQTSASRSVFVGIGLVCIITGGVYFAFQNGWLSI